MTATDLIQDVWNDLQQGGTFQAFRTAIQRVFRDFPLTRLDRLGYNCGPNVYEYDWDLLIVLDACRADLMQEVYQEYAFVDEYDKILSVGSKSQQWLQRTFTEDCMDEIHKAIYITANMFSKQLDPDSFAYLDEIWRTQWDDGLGTVPPRPVTDRAITELRGTAPDRLIVHYMQPHYPFINNKLADGINLDYAFHKKGTETNVWNRLQSGEVTRAEVWDSYRENLRLVMNEVELLLRSVDVDDVVITADHGNSFGTLGIYGHPPRPLRCLREVPFLKTTGVDTSGYEPQVTERSGRHTGDPDVETQLSALGYT